MSLTLRASSMPRFMRCASSAIEPKHAVSSSDPAGDLGTAVHTIMYMVVNGVEVTEEVIDAQATKYKVDRDELGMLVYFGRQAWKEVGAHFPDPLCEQDLSTDIGDFQPWGIKLTGHPDVWSKQHDAVLDWKSGWKDADHAWQMETYGILTHAKKAIIVWLRNREIEVIDLNRDAAIERITEQYGRLETQYAIGEWCTYCPRAHECEARRDSISSDLIALGARVKSNHGGKIVRSELGQARILCELAKQVIARVEDEIRNDVERNGPLELPDGRVLAFDESPRTEIVFEKAKAILEQHLTPAQIEPCIKVSVSAVKDQLRASVLEGKGKFEKAVMAELTEAGATTEKIVRSLRARRKA